MCILLRICKNQARDTSVFARLKSTQNPEREYLFSMIGNVCPEFLNNKIEEAHKKRLSGAVLKNDEKLEIRENIL